jgi:hypothetical protein
MNCTSAHGLRETLAAAVLTLFIAGGVGAMTSPDIANNAPSTTNSVNRTNKGDQLPRVSTARQPPQDTISTEVTPRSSIRAPLCCDPAFSPVADPARAHIYKRCIV